MPSFQNKWSKPASPALTERINDAVKPKGPLKPRVEIAIKRLQAQISKLDNMLTKLKQRDEKIFQRIVIATQQHDTQTSKVLSNELAEIRKVSKILGNARMALEQIELRLTTAHDLGDTVVTIMPTIGLMRSLKSSLAKFMPGADQEINKMAEMLGGLMTDTFSGDAAFGIDDSTNAESDKILQEAAAVAESTIDNKFPNTPTESEIPSSTRFM
ncbi:MAG TPA: Snf7 family protein [Nitrosopumilaceae archaeon]|nr:Snf7 family protein [Nitrosopumilaceae archaeon]